MKNSEITAKWLNDMATQIHQNAVEKGFYDDAPPRGLRSHNADYRLQRINLISGEIGEFYEAIRAGKVLAASHPTCANDSPDFAAQYVELVKGTAEEELADVVIRVLDFVASVSGEIAIDVFNSIVAIEVQTLDSGVYNLSGYVRSLDTLFVDVLSFRACAALRHCIGIATYLEINLARAVVEKMAYNKTRPYKHGKKF